MRKATPEERVAVDTVLSHMVLEHPPTTASDAECSIVPFREHAPAPKSNASGSSSLALVCANPRRNIFKRVLAKQDSSPLEVRKSPVVPTIEALLAVACLCHLKIPVGLRHRRRRREKKRKKARKNVILQNLAQLQLQNRRKEPNLWQLQLQNRRKVPNLWQLQLQNRRNRPKQFPVLN